MAMADHTGGVLVVDDERLIREMLVYFLKSRGVPARAAVDGVDALSMVRQGPPDVVLLDHQMPRLDGMNTLRHIKELAPGIRVIMMTACATSEGAQAASELGAEDYISKPLDLLDLLHAVQPPPAGSGAAPPGSS